MQKINKDEIDWSEVHRSNYGAALLSPHTWITQAERLWEVAESMVPEVKAVWDSFQEAAEGRMAPKSDSVVMIHFMLVAFCIENLLKAGIVRKHYLVLKEEFEKGGHLPKLLKTHDLFRLAGECGLTPSDEEEDVLRRLTRAAVWAGRYPLPINCKQLGGTEKFADGRTWTVSHRFGNDVENCRNLVKSIRDQLNLRPVRLPSQ